MNLVELIEDIPEVEVQYNSNPEFRNLVSFRGVAGNEGILVLINGIRMTPATGDFYTMGANFSLVDASRVEVIIGPASALYGVDAFGGIINIITFNQDGRNYSGATVNTSGGNYGTTNNSVNIGFKVDKLLVNLAASQYISAEPDYNNKYDLTYNWYNKSFQPTGNVIESPYYSDVYNLNFFKDRTGADKSLNNILRDFSMPTEAHYIHANVVYDKFTAGYMNNSERHSTAYGLDPRYTAFDKDQFFRQTQHVFYIKHNYTSFNKKWNLQSSIRHNFYEVDPNSNYVGSASRWQRGYVYANGQGTKFEEQLSVDVSAHSSFIGGISYELLNTLPMTGLATHPVDVHKPISLDNIYYIGAAGYDAYAMDANAGKYDPANVLRQTLYPLSYAKMNYPNFAHGFETGWDIGTEKGKKESLTRINQMLSSDNYPKISLEMFFKKK